MSIKVSLVAGIYYPPEINFRRFLDACLDQTMKDVEFIFMIDSPNDVKSRIILKEYEDKFKNNKNTFYIIENKENLGVVANYNKGIELAIGEYIIIADSDDFFDNDWLESMYNYMITNKQIEFLIPAILITYLGEFDILFSILGNDNADDTGLMFTKDTYNKYKKDFEVNVTMPYDLSIDSCAILPESIGSFYYYVRAQESSTSSHVIFDNTDREKSVDFDLYVEVVKREIETVLKKATGKDICIDDYSKEQLIDIAKQYSKIDSNSINNFSYEDLKKI